MSVTMTAKQGHRYAWCEGEDGGRTVIALESGSRVRVAELVPGQPWFGRTWSTHASLLTPQPMAYFHGEVPR